VVNELPRPAAPATTATGGNRPSHRPSVAANAVIFALLGGFVWLIVGLVGYNAASMFGPRTTETAVLSSVDIDFNSSSSSPRRSTYWVEGETESGRSWRMADDHAYDVATRDGYPMDVEVVISEWTGNTLRLTGEGFDVDRSGGAAKYGWLAASLVVAAIALVVTWPIARTESLLAAASYLVLSPLWIWLGFLAMRAIRT
jgi:hypothetical protein